MALVTGCSSGKLRLPFAMGPELTPDEMRQKHGEGAKYLLNEPATASAAPGTTATAAQGVPAPHARWRPWLRLIGNLHGKS